MYKLYIKSNGMYKNPRIFKSFIEAKAHAKGEYLIVQEENGTDTIVEHNVILESKIKDDGDER